MNNIFINKIAEEAGKTFKETGYPSLKDENWRFTDISNILCQQFNQSKKVTLKKKIASKYFIENCYHIVAVNGYLDLSISDNFPENFEVMTIIDSVIDVRNQFSKISNYKTKSFNAINTSMFKEGILLSFPSGLVLDKPIQLINIFLDNQKKQVHYPRLLILANNDTQFSFINHYVFEGNQEHLVNSVVEMEILNNCFIDYCVIQHGNNKSNIIESTAVNQLSNSKLNYNTFTLNSNFSRNDIEINLNNILSKINLNGLYLCNNSMVVDYHTTINHKAENCVSNEKFQGILMDKSKGIFNGLINVSPNAINTDANQKNQNLLLSETTSINSNPQLEIFCDDVSCTHGSTTGYLDDEMIFYLRSRGINKDQAKQILIHGFAMEIVNNINHKKVKEYLSEYINHWILS